jgi:Kef-type K+ transport system membrane component KefB
MGGASSWYSILAITGFLFAIWGAGRASKFVGVSSIVFEVATGLVLGPKVLGLIPAELSLCFYEQTVDCSTRDAQLFIANKGTEFCDLQAYLDADKYAASWTTGFWGNTPNVIIDGQTYSLDGHGRRLAGGNAGKAEFDSYAECLEQGCSLDVALKCAETPDIFTLVGHAGVAMMIFESGMHFNFEQARTVGPKACAVAVLGTFLPIIFGTLLTVGFGFKLFPDGLSVGVALAPTSIGMALKLLHEVSALQTSFGQVVMTAAFVDDVLSLILFSILFSLRGEITPWTFMPLVGGCLFMAVAIAACVKVWPRLLAWIFSKIPETKADAKVTRHDEVMWLLMFVTLAIYAQITHWCGTHLWGCFIAGMSFSHDHHAHHVWVRQVKRVSCWFMRLFFACTLAWAIPIDALFEWDAIWMGFLMGVGPCVLTKVLCGPFMGDARWVIGWAMVGRAEFAYFIAIMAKSVKMMEDEVFAIIIWALIYATIFAPLVFRKVLSNYLVRTGQGNVKPGFNNKLRMSGHLPDLIEEAKAAEESKTLEEFASMSMAMTAKDEEIARLQAVIDAHGIKVSPSKSDNHDSGDEVHRDAIISVDVENVVI